MIRLLILVLVCLAPRIAEAKRQPVVAVLYFDNNSGDGELDVLSKGFADMLITDLSSSEQVTVVEREKLQELLAEAKLQRSRFFDKKTAVKIGKGLGAAYVVSGSFTAMKPKMRIDVRMIEVKTGKVVLGTKVSGLSAQVFDLEQQLVGDFLRRLDLKFFPDNLPATKVPNLDSLLNYSKGLALLDEGDAKQAAQVMQSTVKMAPAFGLARVRHAAIVKRLAASKVQRATIMDRSSQALFQRARNFVATHKMETASKDEAKKYIGYRVLMGAEIALAMHKRLAGRNGSKRLVPRKGSKPATQLMRAYYENLRLLVAEHKQFEVRFGSARASLGRDEEQVAGELKMNYSVSSPSEKLLAFVLQGRVDPAGEVPRFTTLPALADLDPKIRKASLKLAATLSTRKKGNLLLHEKLSTVRILEMLAEYHIDRERVEAGIGELQKILDRFPKLPRWDYYEGRIKQQLGLKHEHSVSRRKKYQKGLRACDAWELHVGHRLVLGQRMRYMGLKAFSATLQEVEKACRKSPELAKMKKSLFQSFFLEAAQYNDCEWFDLYIGKWLALGGSTRDAAGYRKNYSSCPLRTP